LLSTCGRAEYPFFVAPVISTLCVGDLLTAPVTHRDQGEGYEKNCGTKRPANILAVEQFFS
jgi:hypothetical protein